MNKEQKAKSKFRQSAKWKDFRKRMKQKNKVDFLTEKPLYAGWNLHHCDLDSKHYEMIDNEENFACLNRTSHEVVHWLYRYKDWREVLERLKTIMEKMEALNQ